MVNGHGSRSTCLNVVFFRFSSYRASARCGMLDVPSPLSPSGELWSTTTSSLDICIISNKNINLISVNDLGDTKKI